MKIVTVVGARLQLGNAASLPAAIVGQRRGGGAALEEVMVHTGQRYDQNMSQVFFDQLELPRRPFDKRVPEEVNRILMDHVSRLLIAEKAAELPLARPARSS